MTKNETRGDHQKEKMIKVARELFATQGFEATTTRKINKEAGTAEGLLYYYFPHGKHEILDTIVYRGIMNRMNPVQISFEGCQTISDLENRLMTVFERVWQVFQDEASYQSFMITIRERMLLSDKQADWLMQVLESLVSMISAQFKTIATILPVDATQYRPLARVITSIYQKVIYDELLIRNNREMTPAIKAALRPQLQLVLGLLQTAWLTKKVLFWRGSDPVRIALFWN